MKLDDLKILAVGAIGSLTFGIYHMYFTTKMINEYNRNIQLRFDDNNRNIQLRFDENNRNIQLRFDDYNRNNQLRFDELFMKIDYS
jgi:hypothetical protein